ncbi:MAG: YncE family protein [Planctomycetes bacterium]|nr:YncE family protein [Planctomycetota bacterium]
MKRSRLVWWCVLVLAVSVSVCAQQKYRSPYDLAMSPDGKTLYVSDRTAQCVVLMDTATGKAAGEIALTGRPSGLALSPDGKTLYAAECGAGTVAVIDTAGKKVTARIKVARHPVGLALGPKTKRLYVCNSLSDDVRYSREQGDQTHLRCSRADVRRADAGREEARRRQLSPPRLGRRLPPGRLGQHHRHGGTEGRQECCAMFRRDKRAQRVRLARRQVRLHHPHGQPLYGTDDAA